MYEGYTNIYQAARNANGLTQERAAELLGLSVESVKAYEHDVTIALNIEYTICPIPQHARKYNVTFHETDQSSK